MSSGHSVYTGSLHFCFAVASDPFVSLDTSLKHEAREEGWVIIRIIYVPSH